MLKRFTPVLVITAICWLLFVVNNLLWNGHLTAYGIVPRQIGSLPGILWAPFLHVSFGHLAANTLPLLILGGIICARSRTEFVAVTVAGTILGGALTWLLARNACHVGASGLIFCYFGYLASMAFFKRTISAFLLSIVCLVGYGGMIRGVLPTSAAVSWEGHAAGLIAGITLAWLSSKMKRTQVNGSCSTPPARPLPTDLPLH